jgi:hypothetical protein
MLNQTLKAEVYGVQLSLGPNGERYVKTFIGQKGGDDNTKGISLMSINTDPDVFDKVKLPDYPYPCDLEIQVQRGGQNKMSQRVVGIRPAEHVKPSPAKA